MLIPMGGDAAATLDDIDKRIIAELQVDGRMPFSTLAPLVGLSDAATRQRVNRLIERQVIGVIRPLGGARSQREGFCANRGGENAARGEQQAVQQATARQRDVKRSGRGIHEQRETSGAGFRFSAAAF